MTEFVYIYKELPEDLATNGDVLTDWKDLPEINRVFNEKFSFYGNYSLDGQNADLIKNGHFVKALTENGTWQYFEIFEPKKTLDSISFNGRFIGAMANRNFIESSVTSNGNGTRIMSDLKNSLAFTQKFRYLSDVPTTHQFTAKQVGPIDAIVGSNNGNQNLVGVTGGEFDVDNYDLKLVKQIGADNGYRIDFGVNLESIESEVGEQVVNSLYLIGGVPDNDYDQDKEPLTYKYLEIEGVTDKNRRIGKRENSNCKTLGDLKAWGQSLFDKDHIHEPTATHKVNMVALEHTLEYQDLYEQFAKLHFGDVAHVYVEKLKMDVKERMVEYVWFPTIGKYKSIVLGSNLSKYTSKTKTETEKLADKINNRTETLVTNIINATAWITGNSGGHVVFRPEKGPSEILIMDTREVATAKKVWRWNLNGLGYSNNGINGPYGLAMTSNGEIVADFIKVGIIKAEVLESSFNALGDQLKLVAGALQAWNDGKKIMELTKKGMQFWGNSEEIGTIGTTDSAGNPFPDAQTPTPIEENAIVIRANGTGKYILISPLEGKGLVMLGNGNAMYVGDFINQGDFNVAGDARISGNLTVSGDVEIKGKLTLNGQQVYPGQGGGPSNPGDWDGNYPPEVTTSADKFAWELWVFLLPKGYSKDSIAGILGNVQGEVGPNMNPDTAQVGGPAYGIVQWDGSAYPLVGPATYDGRTYVTNLFNAAGITEEISSMSGQAKLLDWCMYNGQWLGRVSPTSVSGFKTMTDPQTAAYTFEENFERPAAAHPERQGYAQTWYDKFKDLEITKPNNDIVSIAKGWLGWFYYVQLHPSSDLGTDLKNPNKSGGTDCSGFVWLVLNKAGYSVPTNMAWYTGSMTSDARGSHNWLTEISASQSRAGDVVIYNQGDGAGNNGHTAILLEAYKGNDTQIIEMGGDSRYSGVNVSTIGYAFGSLLNGDRCLARAVK